MNETTYLGHGINFWLELKAKAEKLDVIKWLEEIAVLRAKVSFYERRIKEMEDFREVNLSTEKS